MATLSWLLTFWHSQAPEHLVGGVALEAEYLLVGNDEEDEVDILLVFAGPSPFGLVSRAAFSGPLQKSD